ncbi:MAG TPA: YodC family protein [Trinickia sp.]|uniref:YodC family protein n=1 Tax=Trinickia sp. TaxID=2571163 RepID=UPI002BDA2B35|nr:YodC family protein [Trinickia sp.]HTI18290.1 YodC family protein [Trinickia sp.]
MTLKTGGARMTVTHVGADEGGDWLLCQWFDEHGELRQERFLQDALARQPRSIPAGLAHLGRGLGHTGSRGLGEVGTP